MCGEVSGRYRKNGFPCFAASARRSTYATASFANRGSTSVASKSGAVGPLRVLRSPRPRYSSNSLSTVGSAVDAIVLDERVRHHVERRADAEVVVEADRRRAVRDRFAA